MTSRKTSPEQCYRMIDAYLAGAPLEEAAAVVGLSRQACKNALIASGIPLRSRQQAAALNRKHPFDERYFSLVDSEAKAYWLGFISADGSVNHENRSLSVLLGRIDRGHLARFCDALSSPTTPTRLGSYTRNGKRHLTASVSFFSSALLADLNALGVVPRKSLVLVPWQGPRVLMRHYWRGVVDGDGCLHHRSNGYWSVSLVGSSPVVRGFTEFVSQITGSVKEPRPNGNIFHVSYGGTGLPQAIARLLYEEATVSLSRKHALADELMAVTPRHPFGSRRTFSELTVERLNELRQQYGSWYRVAKILEVAGPALTRIRKRLGMPIGKGRGCC